MIRVALCGSIFGEAVTVLGLEPVEERAEVALVDLTDPAGVARACSVAPDVHRIAVGGPTEERLVAALGVAIDLVPTSDPALIGPLIARARPSPGRRPTRTLVVSGISGGVGRTLLVAHLALRLARSASVLVLDATGTGAVAAWLGLSPGSWPDLEGLIDEMTSEHLAVLAAEQGRIRILGSASPMPSPPLLTAAVHAGADLADIVLVDAPSLSDERTRALRETADRVLLVLPDHPASSSVSSLTTIDDRIWLIASRSTATSIAGLPVMRSLPDDPGAVRAAARGPSPVGGTLGRAYDELADLLAVDMS